MDTTTALVETERRRITTRAAALSGLCSEMLDEMILSRQEIAALAGCSVEHLDNEWEAGRGPGPRVRLSERKVGVRYRDYLTWVESRTERLAS